MSKEKLIKQENGSVAVFAIATVFSLIFILGGVFAVSSTNRKNQLRTLLKIKEIYSQGIGQVNQVSLYHEEADTKGYIADGLTAFYDAINNIGSGHSNNTKVWKDISGNGNDLKHQGSEDVTWNDNAYDFVTPETNYFETENAISLGNSSRTIEIVCSLEEEGVENLLGLGTENAGTLNDVIYYNNGVNINNYGNQANEGSSDRALEKGRTYITTITYDSTSHTTNYYTNLQGKENVAFQTINTAATTLTVGKGKDSTHNKNKRFKLQAIRIYNRVLTEEERITNYTLDKERYGITLNENDYASNGLIARFDAIKNVGTTHDNNTGTWKDLSNNNHDATLSNFTGETTSGWTENSLVFDGTDDFATIQGLDLSEYKDITICATYKVLSMPENKAPAVVSSSTDNEGKIYFGYGSQYGANIANANTYAMNYSVPNTWVYGEPNIVEKDKIKNVIVTYMGKNAEQYNRVYCNNQMIAENQTTATTKWSSDTLDIGRAFGGNNTNHPYANIELYSLQIYNRALTKAEVKLNYEIDKVRFGL